MDYARLFLALIVFVLLIVVYENERVREHVQVAENMEFEYLSIGLLSVLTVYQFPVISRVVHLSYKITLQSYK